MSNDKAGLIRAIGEATQLYQESTEAFDEAVGARLGLNATDRRYLGVLHRAGPCPVSHVAAETGLSRAAMTTAIDRIEAAGYVRRVRSAADRRGVTVELTDTARAAIAAIWGPLLGGAERVFTRYSTAQLETILDFLRRSRAAQVEHARRVSGEPRKPKPDSAG